MSTHEMITPIGLRLTGRRVVFAGGGPVAERKLLRMLDSGADITLISPTATPELQKASSMGQITLHVRTASPDDFVGAFLAFIATDDEVANRDLAAAARTHGALVNRADDPDDCDFVLPALAYAAPMHIGVFSGSPALSKWVRRHVERTLGPEFPEFAAAFAEIRNKVRATGLPQAARAEILNRLLNEGLYQQYRDQGMRGASSHVETILEEYRASTRK